MDFANIPVQKYWKAIRLLIIQAVSIAAIAYLFIVIAVYSIPHLPLANGRTFHALLRAQMSVDRGVEIGKNNKGILLFLGSSVVERGVSELFLDSLLTNDGITNLETTNSGTGGFFASANFLMFRAMLDRGLRPNRVLYGFFLQELNGASNVHINVSPEDSLAIQMKEKSLPNVIRFGPQALFTLFDPGNMHTYLFAAKHAFREVHDMTMLDRLIFGQNMFERDSTYVLNTQYLDDLEHIILLCKSRNIPIALYNTPVRPVTEHSLGDLPYLHREEAYLAVYNMARRNNVPVWNLDRPGIFDSTDFLDTYHLNSTGIQHQTRLLEQHIVHWIRGDTVSDTPQRS